MFHDLYNWFMHGFRDSPHFAARLAASGALARIVADLTGTMDVPSAVTEIDKLVRRALKVEVRSAGPSLLAAWPDRMHALPQLRRKT